MEESKNQLIKNTMTWGGIIGAVLVGVSYVLSALKLADFGVTNFVTFFILVGGLFVTVKKHRDELNGIITYKQALIAGVYTALFASIIIGFFTYIHLKFIDQELLVKIIELNKAQFQAFHYSDEQIAVATKLISPFFMFVSQMIAYTFWGTIFSLIIAAFLKKAPTTIRPNSDIQ